MFRILCLCCLAVCGLALVSATDPILPTTFVPPTKVPPTKVPPTRRPPIVRPQQCPRLSEEMRGCLRQWACQNFITWDMRCLLEWPRNPLLKDLLGQGGGA